MLLDIIRYIGTGAGEENDPGNVIQLNEVTQLNGAKVRFNSVDPKGDFRVGDLFCPTKKMVL